MQKRAAIICMLLSACGIKSSESSLEMSLSARHHIELPEDIVVRPIQVAKLREDWPYRRKYAWGLWSQLLEIKDNSIYTFQTWYDADDIKRIFKILFGELTPDERKNRSNFSLEQINNAETLHIQSLLEQHHWTAERYTQWLHQYETPQQKRSIPGIQRVLYNRAYVHHILKNYSTIISCLTEPVSEKCIPPFPLETIILKTSWKRWEPLSIEGYDLTPSNIQEQLGQKQWSYTNIAETEPKLGVLDSVSGTRFFLVGMHMAVKTHTDWLWSTLWWSPNNSILGHDRPSSMQNLDYQMCAVSDYSHTFDESQFKENSQLGQLLSDINGITQESSWCSNPYLEEGDNNNKTNCIGCHQHAGDIHKSQEIVTGLTTELSRFQTKQKDIFTGDYNWSLDFASQNIQHALKQIVDYFDTYDI